MTKVRSSKKNDGQIPARVPLTEFVRAKPFRARAHVSPSTLVTFPQSNLAEGAPIRVAAYARYSRAKDHEATTIETQLEGIRNYVESKGWILFRNYIDEEVPGSTPPEERPGLQELLDDMAAKKFDVVMSLDDSRLARDNLIFWNLIERFRAAKVTYKMLIVPEVDSDKDEFDTFAASMQGGSSFLRKRTSKVTKAGLDKLKSQGFARSRAPYGFKLVPADPDNPKSHRKIVPDELGQRAIDYLAANPKAKLKVLAEYLDLDVKQAWRIKQAVLKYGSGP